MKKLISLLVVVIIAFSVSAQSIVRWTIEVPFERAEAEAPDVVAIDMKIGDAVSTVTNLQAVKGQTKITYRTTLTSAQIAQGFSFRPRGANSKWIWPNGAWTIVRVE